MQLAAAAALVLTITSPLLAEEVVDISGAVPATEASPPRPSLIDLWRRREAAMEAGDGKLANSLWNDILTTIGFMGIARAEPFGVLELARGVRSLEAGDVEGSQIALDRALKLDPALWSALHVRAAASLKRSILDLPSALVALTQSWRHRLANEESRYFVVTNGALVAAVALALTSLAFAVAALVRHGARFRHDVSEFFAGSFPEELTIVLGWGFLILPLLAWLGIYWATLYWLAVLVAYMGTRERVLALVAIVMAGATPILQEWALSRAIPVICRPAPALVSQSWGLGSVGARVAELEVELKDTKSVDATRFLAYALRDAGRFSDSLALLEGLNAEGPGDPRVLLDIGNVHFIEGRNSLAIHYYTEATKANASSALPFHNLALAYNKDMRLDLSENVRHKAETLDPTLGTKAAARGGLAIADDRPTFLEVLALAAPAMDKGAYSSLRARNPGADLFRDAFALGALAAFAAALFTLSLRKKVAARCSRCHQAFCRRCKVEPESPTLCAACLHVFVKRTGIVSGAREAREAEIVRRASHRRGLQLGLAFLFPGLSQVSRGQAILGGLLVLAGGLAVGAATVGRTFVEPLQGLGLQVTSGLATPAALFLAAWLLGIALAWRARDREESEG